MPGIDERIEVLKGCLKCVNTVSLTEFTPGFNVVFSTLEHVEVMTTFMGVEAQEQNFDDAVANMERTFPESAKPKIFVNSLGMVWISDEWFEEGALKRIFMLGPVFLDDYSVSNLEKQLEKLHISIALKHQFMKYIFSTPILSLSRFYEYGIMLHYCITGDKISVTEFLYPEYQKKTEGDEIFSWKHGTYLAEQEMLRLVEEGNLDYEDALYQLNTSGDVGNLSNGSYLRQQKNSAIMMTTLCSRAAIRGGLASETALSLCDEYVRKVECTEDLSTVIVISTDMVRDFVTRVHRLKSRDDKISPQIRKACDYIALHPEQKPDIHSLAEMLGYTDYYFSNKFKQETGKSVREYVTDYKIERAKALLRESSTPIQEIADTLGFGSQSYFGDIFRKRVGMTPGEYRASTP